MHEYKYKYLHLKNKYEYKYFKNCTLVQLQVPSTTSLVVTTEKLATQPVTKKLIYPLTCCI